MDFGRGLLLTNQSGQPIQLNPWTGVVRCADLDGDDLFDLLVTDGEQVRLYSNLGVAGNPAFEGYTRLPGPTGDLSLRSGANRFAMADWDGDGLQDILSGAEGTLRFYRNTGSPSSPFFAEGVVLQAEGVPTDLWGPSHLCVTDVTGNGLPDVLVGTSQGYFLLFKNTGSPSNPVLAA
jgi:hypothetical protein